MYTSLVLAAKVTVQVIMEHREEFLQEMSAKDIALQLKVRSLIPESMEHEIIHSKCREDGNGHLLTFLMTGASEIQVQQTLKVASEKMEYGRMSQFASNILQQLQPGQFVAWLVVVSPTLGYTVVSLGLFFIPSWLFSGLRTKAYVELSRASIQN